MNNHEQIFEELVQKLERLAWTYGIRLPKYNSIQWCPEGRFSHVIDGDIYVSRNDESSMMRTLAHEFGHLLEDQVSDRDFYVWVDGINGIFGLPNDRKPDWKFLYERIGPSGEVFAKTFENLIMDDEDTSYYEERTALLLHILHG